MKGVKITIASAALVAMAGVANAASLEPSGWEAGIALGAALPQGVYFIHSMSSGGWRGIDDTKSKSLREHPGGVLVDPLLDCRRSR